MIESVSDSVRSSISFSKDGFEDRDHIMEKDEPNWDTIQVCRNFSLSAADLLCNTLTGCCPLLYNCKLLKPCSQPLLGLITIDYLISRVRR